MVSEWFGVLGLGDGIMEGDGGCVKAELNRFSIGAGAIPRWD
jgi:hypothetical protein